MSEAIGLFSDGEAYERWMGRWSRCVGAFFIDWLAAPPGLHWLDVGCGNGAFTAEVVARCAPAAVTGIDPSEPQLAYARASGLTGTTFINGDAQALPFGNGAFDVAAMALVIASVPDAPKAIAEMVRVVRSGGLVASYIWELPDGLPSAHLVAAMKAMRLAPSVAPNIDVARRDTMQEMWRNAGLTGVETRAISVPVSFSGFDDYWETQSLRVGPSGQAIARLDAAQTEELRAQLRERLPIAADGTIAFHTIANAVQGRVP